MPTVSIIIGGDLVPTQSNRELFSSAGLTDLFGEELLNNLAQAQFRIFNLECPLTDIEGPIIKNGPNLIAPTTTVNAIKGLRTDLVTLANNHVLDQGERGLASTIETLIAHDIGYVGAGKNLSAASQPYILESDKLRFGIYACAEHEFTIALEDSAGANPFDPLESLDHISNLRNLCDYLIVLFHGGKEHYRYPSPNLKKTCHKMVDKGADLVVCQHSHCIGAYEEYQGSTIVYGQGNFVFDDSANELWKTSLLIKLTVTDKDHVVDFIPLVKQRNGVRLAGKEQAEEILMEFSRRSQMILNDGFLQEEYEKLAAQMLENYLTSFYGGSFTFKVINKLTGHKLMKMLHTKKSMLQMLNFIDCESHRELMSVGLKEKTRL